MHPNKRYINIADSLANMSYKSQKFDIYTKDLLQKAEDLLVETINPQFIIREHKTDNIYELLRGHDVIKHINKCNEIIIFAATLGGKIDEIIHKVELTDSALAFCLDAVADTAIENFCDEIEMNVKSQKGIITGRYSPGYGDWEISVQENILSVLNTQKTIGLTCNENNILIPRKSVTAIIGVYTPYISR